MWHTTCTFVEGVLFFFFPPPKTFADLGEGGGKHNPRRMPRRERAQCIPLPPPPFCASQAATRLPHARTNLVSPSSGVSRSQLQFNQKQIAIEEGSPELPVSHPTSLGTNPQFSAQTTNLLVNTHAVIPPPPSSTTSNFSKMTAPPVHPVHPTLPPSTQPTDPPQQYIYMPGPPWPCHTWTPGHSSPRRVAAAEAVALTMEGSAHANQPGRRAPP